MKYKINDEEKMIIEHFKCSRIPAIFKDEYIDHILFIELVDFDICSLLLKGEKIPYGIYDEAILEFQKMKNHINTDKLDEVALRYYDNCIQIINIMMKHQ